MAQMSTPISNIPIQPVSVSQSKVEEDPEVSALLNEMQKQSSGVSVPVQAIPIATHYAPPPQSQVATKPYLDYDILQKTLYVAIIAFIVFYPNVFDILYIKFPFLEQFHTYEIFARALLLAMIIYAIIWKFDSPQ